MKELKFIQLQKDNDEHCKLFENLMIPYMKELDEHKNRVTPEDFVFKFTHSILKMQGPYDRHLELCYDNEKLIGFLYGKVDHENHKGFIKPGYGYIMEFYVKPEYRNKGYGKAMFERIEDLFASHGTKRMYLTADPVTGRPFWEAMGFKNTSDVSPENGQFIFEKNVRNPREIITITISDYLTHSFVEKITAMQWHSTNAEWLNRVRESVYGDKYDSDCFTVIAENEKDDVIGRLYCIQNQENPKRWYYGDLVVKPSYRRMRIATRMIKAAIQRVSDMSGDTVCCFVEPSNAASIHLQKSLGFIEKPTKSFNLLTVDGDIMFELTLDERFNVIPATAEEARFVMMFYAQNLEVLHGKYIPLAEWKEILSKDDPDEQNFLICKGAMPVAWLRVNGLLNKDMAWISMLAVSDNMHRKGIGSFAVQFAENFVRSKGINIISIHTTDDNIPAINLYKKYGYDIIGHGECTTGDGVKRKGYTFKKILE